MDVMQAISDRRSIRKFEDRPVSRELIEQVLDAAIKAPSGKTAPPDGESGVMSQVMNLVDIQSIGAAIQNMLLAAVGNGLGSLWICDILVAAKETAAFVGLKGGLIAAVSLGYPAESPPARPRKSMEEAVTWME